MPIKRKRQWLDAGWDAAFPPPLGPDETPEWDSLTVIDHHGRKRVITRETIAKEEKKNVDTKTEGTVPSMSVLRPRGNSA